MTQRITTRPRILLNYLNFKPASSHKTQLLIAALMWTLVGFGLLGFGLKWLLQSRTEWVFLLLLGVLLIGVTKGVFMLRKSALRAINRIKNRGDGTCVFGVFSLWQWMLVGVMITGGRLLRMSGLPDEILGTLYAAIGIALFIGSVATWSAWRHS